MLLPQLNAYAVIRYVKPGGSGTKNGLSWANASADLQEMINQSSDTAIDTIYVAEGKYTPNRPANALHTIDPANRNNTFTFTKNIRVFGGFPVAGNPIFADRVVAAYETILSGDIGTPGVNTDNAYHVVITVGTAITNAFVMDGFTISDGFANVANPIYIHGDRIDARSGTGWHNYRASPVMRNMVITNNRIGYDGTGSGVGFYNESGNPELLNVVFSNNGGDTSFGGAGYNFSGSVVLTNVIIQGNRANVGGGWYHLNGKTTFNNVTIVSNSASSGGGVFAYSGILTFNNCIVAHNTASWGPGVNMDGDILSPPVVNYHYSLVQGVAAGGNQNLDGSVDPAFENPVPTSAAPTAAGDYRLKATSPCVNMGSNALVPSGLLQDLGGRQRIMANAVEMGAYETCDQVTLAANQTSVTGLLSDMRNDLFDVCSLVATVEPTGNAPVSGALTAQTWIKGGIVHFGNARYVRRHYDLAPVTNKENATADITLYYSQEDFTAYNDVYGTSSNALLPTGPSDSLRGNIRMAQFRGDYRVDRQTVMHLGPPTYIVPKSVMWNETNRFWEVTFSVTGFSGFFLTGQSDAALPVTLIGFGAKKQEHDIQLSWQTSNETNSEYFEVQRSLDSRHFEAIGTVSAAGESTKTAIYQYSDKVVARNTELYYRLKMVDHDGSYAHSRIVSISGEGNANKRVVNLYPNPSNGRIMIETIGMEQPEIVVYDLSGRKTPFTSQSVSMGKTQLTFSTPQSGIYTVVIKQGHYVTVKIIVME